MYYSIAVDGPAGAGKSTIAKGVAAKLGFVYIDTGAMYRAMTLFYVDKGIDCDDEEEVIRHLDEIDIRISYAEGAQHVFLNGADVSGLIRTQAVSDNASKVSAIARVRSKLVAIQQELALTENVIMDGRDIGSVVLPNAQLKIYLTADAMVRAERRYKELIAKGETAELEVIAEEIKERDYRDMHREASPLVKVEDAVEVDTSYMSIEEVENTIIGLFEKVKSNEG